MKDYYSKKLKCKDCERLIHNDSIRCKSCSNSHNAIGKRWSDEHRKNFQEAFRKKREMGINALGKKIPSYYAVHFWLYKMYGKANKCEHCKTNKAYRYEWAVKKGCDYLKNINNFIQLCVKCHRTYDKTNAWQLKQLKVSRVNRMKKYYEKRNIS